MSLTEGWAVFVSAHESALNDLVTALTTVRPHLLSYGSPAFTPVSTRFDTAMAVIPFPGTGGIDGHVPFTTPHLDLYKQEDPLPPELTPGPNDFSMPEIIASPDLLPPTGKGDGDEDDESRTAAAAS